VRLTRVSRAAQPPIVDAQERVMRWVAGLAVGLALGFAGSAGAAAIVTVTYSGTVTGIDSYGVFGAPGV
jgi:hypothetical protein